MKVRLGRRDNYKELVDFIVNNVLTQESVEFMDKFKCRGYQS